VTGMYVCQILVCLIDFLMSLTNYRGAIAVFQWILNCWRFVSSKQGRNNLAGIFIFAQELFKLPHATFQEPKSAKDCIL
jgi:hypothetical protein